MTTIKPSIFIQRARIIHSNKIAYDQTFHNGINIIAGENSVGKTSLIQLIMHGLGYAIDDAHWKEEAKLCTIYLEIKVNGKSITVQRGSRSLASSYEIPMLFCLKSMEEALKENIESWERYPYKKIPNRESFSTNMLRLLEIPAVKENDQNINLHNMFRLLYSNQERSLATLYNSQRFDSKQSREDIANYLLNTYDNNIVLLKRELDEKSKELKKYVDEVNSFHDISQKFSQSFVMDGGISKQQIENKKNNIINSINEEHNNISKLRNESFSSLDATQEQKEIKKNSESLRKIKTQIFEVQQNINFLEYDINDSENFINELNITKISLIDAITLSKILKNTNFSHCPSCFSELKETKPTPENCCPLCHSEINNKELNLLQMKHEIEMQLTESDKILERKKNKLQDLKTTDKQLSKILTNLTNKIKTIKEATNIVNDEKIYNLYSEISSLQSKLELIEKSIKAYEYIEEITSKRDILQKRVNDLEARIQAENNAYKSKIKENDKTIKTFLSILLENDNSGDEDFKKINSIELDFGSDSLVLNNKSLSASSTGYLYHSLQISLLLSSLKLDYLRIPRIVIIDGLDSNGIDQERLKNFQIGIKKQLDNFLNIEHQLFFTTGIVADELTTCIVNKFYNKGEHTLNF